MAKNKDKNKVLEGLPQAGSPEMDKYTADQLDRVFEHRVWTNPYPEALSDEDVKQGLIQIAESTDIQKVFVKLRNAYQRTIMKMVKNVRNPEINVQIERLAVKHDFVQTILDRAESVYAQRSKQKNQPKQPVDTDINVV